MKFDSIREFERFQELHLLERAKKISGLIHQYRIKLSCGGIPVRSKKGRHLAYVVDFTYWDHELGRQRFEDVKGYNTPLGDLKIAVVEAETGNEIEIVR